MFDDPSSNLSFPSSNHMIPGKSYNYSEPQFCIYKMGMTVSICPEGSYVETMYTAGGWPLKGPIHVCPVIIYLAPIMSSCLLMPSVPLFPYL